MTSLGEEVTKIDYNSEFKELYELREKWEREKLNPFLYQRLVIYISLIVLLIALIIYSARNYGHPAFRNLSLKSPENDTTLYRWFG